MQHFQSLSQIPMDPIFQVSKNFMEDPRTEKANLGIGIYTTREGDPYVFPSIAQAAKEIQTENFNYQSMQGNPEFLQNTAKIFFGENLWENYQDKVALQQTCGGTGACRLMADLFFENHVGAPLVGAQPKLLIATPSWSNHLAIFKKFQIETFDHLTPENQPNFEAHKNAFEANPGSIAILHGGLTHNPTGLNLTKDQLKKLIQIANENNIFCFLDFAYLGFGEGLDSDRKYLQEIFEEADNLAIAVSYSKNASLYRHRLGALMIKTESEKQKHILESQLQQMIRESISNLPLFAAEVMNIVFEKYQKNWLQELENSRKDIDERRELLIKKLCSDSIHAIEQKQKSSQKFSHLQNTRGMFALLGLDRDQVENLAKNHGIYLPFDGRINFAGIQPTQINFIAKGLLETTY